MGRCQLASIVVNAFNGTLLDLDGCRDGGSLNGGKDGEGSSGSAENGGDGELHLEIRDAFFLGWREGRRRFEEVGGYGVFVWWIEEEEESLCNKEKLWKLRECLVYLYCFTSSYPLAESIENNEEGHKVVFGEACSRRT